jgi:hypothetical protein
MKPEPKRATPAVPKLKPATARKSSKKKDDPPSYVVVQADVGQIAAVGDNGVAVAGLTANAAENQVSTATAGDHGCAITACKGMTRAGAFSAAVAGDNSQSRASTSGLAMAGVKSYAEVGNWGVAFANEGSTVRAGTGAVACCLPTDPRVNEKKSFSVAAASGGVAIMLVDGGMAQADVGGVLVFGYLDPTTGETILKVGQTQDKVDTPQAGRLKAGLPYRLNQTTHDIEPVSRRTH